jgi:hypothetical protein
MLERAMDHGSELVDAGRVAWFEGCAQGDGCGGQIWVGGHGEGSAKVLHRQSWVSVCTAYALSHIRRKSLAAVCIWTNRRTASQE